MDLSITACDMLILACVAIFQLSADLSEALREAFEAVTGIRDATETILNQQNGFPQLYDSNQADGECLN